MLGSFVGLRARHLQDVGRRDDSETKVLESELDWLLARQLFPSNRALYRSQTIVSSMRGETLFEPHETGHPNNYAQCLNEIYFHRTNQWRLDEIRPRPEGHKPSPPAIDDLFTIVEVKQ